VYVSQVVDEEGDSALIGERGVVTYFEYDCGCGQSYPRDPMIGVQFGSGHIDEFWREELKTTIAHHHDLRQQTRSRRIVPSRHPHP
jgi:hypothetical protein